jgi:hypothetical protein
LSRRNQNVRKKKQTKAFYDWATTGIPVVIIFDKTKRKEERNNKI